MLSTQGWAGLPFPGGKFCSHGPSAPLVPEEPLAQPSAEPETPKPHDEEQR